MRFGHYLRSQLPAQQPATRSRALSQEFLREGRNLVLLGPNGVVKTLLSKNLADLAGYSVLFRTAAELLDDVQCDSPE